MATCNYCMKTIKDDARFCPFCGRDRQSSPRPHHLPPGTVVGRKYRIGAALGEGGFGITYVGLDTALQLRVAIKEFYPTGFVSRAAAVSTEVTELTDPEKAAFYQKGKARFLQEARVLARFSGARGIVDVRDFFEENNTAYIVMEYLDGVTLKEYLKKNGRLSPESTLLLLTPVMESLKLLHAENVIHRDISPDNIMLVGKEVKLLDFGAARSVGGDRKSLSVMLKPGYAPEEQYRSKGKQGPWTDIYALCATMYRCITGVRPDESTDRIWEDNLQPPSKLGIDISPQMEAALMKGLAVKAEDRWQTMDALLAALSKKSTPAPAPQKRAQPEKPASPDDALPPMEFVQKQISDLHPTASGHSAYEPRPTPGVKEARETAAFESEIRGMITDKKENPQTAPLSDKKTLDSSGINIKKVSIIVAVLIGIVFLVATIGVINNNKNTIATKKLKDFSLIVDGTEFQFPLTVGDVKRKGWNPDTINTENLQEGKERYCSFSTETAMVQGYVFPEEDFSGDVDDLRFRRLELYPIADIPEFEMNTSIGLRLGYSTMGDVKEMLGDPTEYIPYGTEYLDWGYNYVTDDISVCFYGGDEDDTLETLDDEIVCCIRYVDRTFSDDKDEIITNTSINKDDYYLTIDGVDYQLPLKISDFQKNGWYLDENEEVYEDIPGFTTRRIYTPSGKKWMINIYSKNYSSIEDYDVWELSFFTYEEDERSEITFHCNSVSFTLDECTEDKLPELLGRENETDGNDMAIFYIYKSDKGTNVRFGYYKEDADVTNIKLNSLTFYDDEFSKLYVASSGSD